LTDILLVLFGFVASVVILVALPYAISRYLASRSARKEFEVIGKQMGLNEEEIALLYKCASTLEEPNKGKSYGAAVEAFKNILAEIRHISGSGNRTCFGLKFLNLKKDYEDTIRRFIIEEQREALKAYKMDR
jgi:hypothetical protein